VEALALICFVLSWLGLAPFAGGIGKFALLGAAVRREWYMLAAMGLVAITLTVVAMGRLLLNLLIPVPPLEAAGERSQGGDGILRGRKIFLLALGAPLALASVFSDALLRWASLSLRFIFW
jgi:NADH:ubiquinone oxidoreductase subunit 2 (subunit N)